jgi:hypothetical protein
MTVSQDKGGPSRQTVKRSGGTVSFYLKKTYVDNQPDIELVNIHYTWTAAGTPPNWEAHRETRVMPRGGVLMRGMGGTTIDEHGQSVQTTTEKIELPDDGVRRKVIRLPKDVYDPSTGHYEEHYLFHHFFEVFRGGQREYSPLFTEEIVTKELEFAFYDDSLSGGCIYWSLGDWDSPQYTPTEEHNFVARYGEDNPFRSHKFYGFEDKETFNRIRSEMVRALPLPRRFRGKVKGPKGTVVNFCLHTGGFWTPNLAERWEDYRFHNTTTL